MKTILLNYFDPSRSDVASLSIPNMSAFASSLGYEHVVEQIPSKLSEPFMQKVHVISRYLPLCDRLIYVDVDFLFNPSVSASTVDSCFVSQINATRDFRGILQPGHLFLKSTEAVKTFVFIWKSLGIVKHAEHHDQDTFHLLTSRFQSMADLCHTLPASAVSNYLESPGSVGHHFWCKRNVPDCLSRMQAHPYYRQPL